MVNFKKIGYIFLDILVAIVCMAVLLIQDFSVSAPKCFFVILVYAAVNVLSGRYADDEEL